jgi:hypothetical protein
MPTVNPYTIFGTQFADGLTAISKALTPRSTIDDLVKAVYDYVQPIYYPKPTPIIEIEIKSVIYNAINTYRNNLFNVSGGYDDVQAEFIDTILCSIKKIPVNAIETALADAEDNVGKSGMSADEQTPLLLSLAYGSAAFDYWVAAVDKPGSWKSFFNPNPAINYANVPFWTQAAIEGGLIGYNASPRGLIAPTMDIVSTELISSLLGALAIGAGKVAFNWLPLITFGFGGDGSPAARKTNTEAGSYTDVHGLVVKYSADYSKGKTTRYYFD